MLRRLAGGVVAVVVAGSVGCGGADDSSTTPDATTPATSARDLAERLDCEVDEARSEDSIGITYMLPVRSDIMTDAVVCRLHGDESVHVFYRPSDRGPMTEDQLSFAFTHGSPDSPPGGNPSAECSPWLVIGPNYVVQVGTDRAADDVRSALSVSDDVRAEPTTRTPISLLVPGPCDRTSPP
jgi:hypothetical protein